MPVVDLPTSPQHSPTSGGKQPELGGLREAGWVDWGQSGWLAIADYALNDALSLPTLNALTAPTGPPPSPRPASCPSWRACSSTTSTWRRPR